MPELPQSIHARVMTGIAHVDPPADLLADVCRAFEEAVPGTIAGVTILDRTAQLFQHAVFPSLSDEYAEGLQGIEVADRPGTCALAVFEGRTVECNDVRNDDRFSPAWKELSLKHGMEAVLSIPTSHRDGLALGTFVVAFSPDSPLNSDDRARADDAARLAGLVLTYRHHQLSQELIVGELQHRVRNLFSAIGAVVYSTLKSHPEPEAFRKTFDGRLTALSRAHALTLEPRETDLRELLVNTLAPYSVDHRVTLKGPVLLLAPEAAVAFSLATHELATNAAKYGALSAQQGAVRVEWEFGGERKDRFHLKWQETGGPPVSAPTRQGYGQKTLHRSIASAVDGKVELDYRPEGLVCSVSAPLSPRLGARTN